MGRYDSCFTVSASSATGVSHLAIGNLLILKSPPANTLILALTLDHHVGVQIPRGKLKLLLYLPAVRDVWSLPVCLPYSVSALCPYGTRT
jgi:hypothetical protein